MFFVKLIAYPFIIVVGALAVFAYKNVKKIFNKYRTAKQVVVDPSWEGFIRKDFNQWDQKNIKIGCFLRFPFKFIALVLTILTIALLMLFSLQFEKVGKKILLSFFSFAKNRVVSNIFDIKEINIPKIIQTPIIISNHVSWIDIVYLMALIYPVSIVAKLQVSSAPIIGAIAKHMQCLFVTRERDQARKQMLQQIKQRIDNFNKRQGINPLLIFPEGTTSNGRSILRFKIGAFSQLPKITIFGLVYDCQGFQMGMDQITPLQHILISLSLHPKLTVKATTVYPFPSENPEDYMLRCQQTMSELTGFSIYNSGYTQKCAFKEIRLLSMNSDL